MSLRKDVQRLRERVEELEAQIENKSVTVKRREYPDPFMGYGYGVYYNNVEELTLNGKVEALINHLGLDVKMEQKKCTPAKPKVTKVKAKK